MKKSKFTESQIIKALKENEQGRKVGDISREMGIDTSTFYYWRKKYGGMEVAHMKRLKELEEENPRLKQMYADASLDIRMLKDVLSKKFHYSFGRSLEISLLVWLCIASRNATFSTVSYSVLVISAVFSISSNVNFLGS